MKNQQNLKIEIYKMKYFFFYRMDTDIFWQNKIQMPL